MRAAVYVTLLLIPPFAWLSSHGGQEQVPHLPTPSELAASDHEPSVLQSPTVSLEDALQTPATPEDVRALLRATRSTGEGDIARLREAALASTDAMVVGNALQALARMGALIADEELLALLDDSRPRVRSEVVRGLGSYANASRADRERAVGLLVEMLGDEDDPTLRALALQSLGSLGGDRAQRALNRISESTQASAIDRAFAKQALYGGFEEQSNLRTIARRRSEGGAERAALR